MSFLRQQSIAVRSPRSCISRSRGSIRGWRLVLLALIGSPELLPIGRALMPEQVP